MGPIKYNNKYEKHIKSIKLILILIFSFLCLFNSVSRSETTGVIRGKATVKGKPLKGVKILFYTSAESGFKGKAFFESELTKEDGVFEVTLPAGKYFIIARKQSSGSGNKSSEEYFAYYGGNPVTIGSGDVITIGINLTSVINVRNKRVQGGTGIKGKVFLDGAPLANARVTLYQDADTIFRGIGYASTLTGKNGEFTFNLDTGKYYVVARKRLGDDRMGPLGEGGIFGFANENPVEVVKNRYTLVYINTSEKQVKLKEIVKDITVGGTAKSGKTVVSGVIRDRSGKPVSGVYAMAYRDPMMTQKPDFISPLTGEDGFYTIDLAEGGEYFIGARTQLGGPPSRGELLGRYKGNESHSINIKTGERLDNIDIIVETVE